MCTRATLLLVVIGCGIIGSRAHAQDVARPPQLSRVDSSAPLSGGERWVKDNGRWKLPRINYRYLDHADYAPRPPQPTTNDDFPRPQHNRFTLRSRWFGGSRWGSNWGPGWGYGWGGGPGFGWRNGGYGYGGYGSRFGLGFGLGWGFGRHHHHHHRWH